MRPRINCIGGAVLDLIYGLDELPSHDGKIAVRYHAESGGGMAANAAVMISRLGGEARWCGRLGEDETGRSIRDGLRREGVDTRLARSFQGHASPHSVVLIDQVGRRSILLFRPEMNEDPAWLPLAELLQADAILADNRWIAGAVATLSAARARGLPAILDAENADAAAVATIASASHAIFSESGLAGLFDTHDPIEGLHRAAPHAPFVAVTLGDHGVMWLDAAGSPRHLPAFGVTAVETSGAGDVFHGAFAFALVTGRDEAAALSFAAAAAALKCAARGGRASFPSLAAVEALAQTG
jgi:sulfofructose kinase